MGGSGGRARAWGRFAVAGALALAACRGAPDPGDPLELTLVNRTGGPVAGALLRFDGPLSRVDRLSRDGFSEIRLRVAPADTVRLEGGRLEPAQAATYEIAGVEGPPRLLDARWILEGDRMGPARRDQEIRAR